MKHLFLSLLFSASLTAFSQDKAGIYLHEIGLQCGCWQCAPPKPDTLRAIILATMCRRCAAEAIRGYVVISPGKRPVYLNGRKRSLKGSQVGWGWVEANPNAK